MNEDDMRFVVFGERNCAETLSCWIEDTGNYDHKRSHAERHGRSEWQRPTTAVAGKHSLWVFFIERSDGSVFSLHPNYNNVTVDYCNCGFNHRRRCPPDEETPSNGPGGPWGPGTFTHFRNKGVDWTVRFDEAKPKKEQGQGQGQASTAVTWQSRFCRFRTTTKVSQAFSTAVAGGLIHEQD